MSEQCVWSSDQDVFNLTVSRDKCSGVVYWGCMRDFFKSATAAVMLSAVCATSLYAGEGSEPAANYDFGGHRFNVSSGEFDNEGICSVELDDMHPKEYQITVETVSRPSLEDFTVTFKDMKQRCSSVTFIDSQGNISSEPKETEDRIYRFEAKCFRGNGAVNGYYDSKHKFYKYTLIYAMSDEVVKKLASAGITDHMDRVLVRTCPFYTK